MHPVRIEVAARPETIHATIYAAAPHGRQAAVLILAHGAGAGQASPFMTEYAAALAGRGLDVITFDFPYMARGRRAPDRAPVLEDAFLALVAGMAARGDLRHRKVFLGGKSMGGRIATHIGAEPTRWPEAAPALSGVIALGYPLVPPGGRRSGDRASHLRRLRVPTLIVQGTRDPFGGPDEVREAVFTGAAPPVDIHTVPGGDHSFGVLKSSGLDQAGVHAAIQDRLVTWSAVQGAR